MVERVRAGVVVAFATVPARPLAVATDTVVTVPVPPAAIHLTPPAEAASADNTVPSLPTVVIPTVPAPVPEINPPLAIVWRSAPVPP